MTILELLILGPAPPPTRVHHLKPFELGTAPITVHKDGSQQHASFGKAAFAGRIFWSPNFAFRYSSPVRTEMSAAARDSSPP